MYSHGLSALTYVRGTYNCHLHASFISWAHATFLRQPNSLLEATFPINFALHMGENAVEFGLGHC